MGTNFTQSKELIALGLKPGTADMYSDKCHLPEYGEYYLHMVAQDIDSMNWFSARTNRYITPAWSLLRLMRLIETSVSEIAEDEPFELKVSMFSKRYLIEVRKSNPQNDVLVCSDEKESIVDCCISIIEIMIDHKIFKNEFLK